MNKSWKLVWNQVRDSSECSVLRISGVPSQVLDCYMEDLLSTCFSYHSLLPLLLTRKVKNVSFGTLVVKRYSGMGGLIYKEYKWF